MGLIWLTTMTPSPAPFLHALAATLLATGAALALRGSAGLGAAAAGMGAAVALAGVWTTRAARDAGERLETLERRGTALEGQLQEQRRTIDALADGLDAALLICDRRGNVQYANPPAHRLFGHDAMRGQTLIAATLSVDLEGLLLQASEAAVREEIVFAYPREWTGLATAWPDPAEDRVFVSVYEITELRRLERSRRDFVANVSHELRTPMTIIRGYAETLLDEDPPTSETANRMLPRIIAEVDRLSTITGDLLVLSVAESNPVRKQRCDLAEVVRDVTTQLVPKAREKGLLLTYEGEETLPVQANHAQVGQVALNLVDNALNYTTKGSVRVSLVQEGDRAVLTVRDTGLGIATEHVERVFERFYRVDRGRSRATGGTGLGLSIVRHIVEAHGGRVGLESALHRGSTFRVELPLE